MFSPSQDNQTPPTPDTETDSDSDVFNPFSKSSLRRTASAFQALPLDQPAQADHRNQHQQARAGSPLHSYPSSYEHTLLPSGIRLGFPFGSPPPRDAWLPGDQVDAGVHERQREREEEADDEDSLDEADVSPSRRGVCLRNGGGGGGGGERDGFCQVFAKTTATFDPFAADEYVPRFGGAADLNAKVTVGQGRDVTLDVSDSARRVAGEEGKEGSWGEEESSRRFFSGSSRYLLVSLPSGHSSVLETELSGCFHDVDRRLGFRLRVGCAQGMHRGE